MLRSTVGLLGHADNGLSALRMYIGLLVVDYTRYEQNGEVSDTSSKQNQMLPIYCSIMGFIIVFLLLYVVYKLWKQREAMTNAKLCEVYTSSGYSTVKLPVNSTQMDSVLNGPCGGDGNGAADHVKSEHISRLTTKHLCGTNRQQERDPLIANFETGASELSYLEIQLVTLQRDVLGMICFQLSRSGWRELATNMDIPTTSLLGPSANDSEFATQLAQAAQEAKHLILKESATQNSPDEDTVKASARLLAKLCQQPTANVRVLLAELERINRSDIIAFISDKLTKVTSSPAIPISSWSATNDPRV
ncbi:tumor necrosis factor receptor related [Clonorchis sinensis]|uniref:Tumor necrosis factor receptor related n=1 Tax=Clonorchis sinensis TaxID=79923 RepID=G7YTH8_CLOSI|nr:tumor necrosis factor receptor related [Clonorchis sinensis]